MSAVTAVASTFVHTALLVDDQARSRPTLPNAAEPIELPPEHGIFESAGGSEVLEDLPDEDVAEEWHGIDSGAIVDSFADRTVACAVLSPNGGTDADRARALSLAAAADIVIFDWLINPAKGGEGSTDPGLGMVRTSASLIRDLASADLHTGGRLRLICVYTGNPDLDEVIDQVQQVLGEVFGAARVSVEQEARRVLAPHMQVLVVSKPRGSEAPAGVAEADLPAQLIDAFDRFAADGLLPRVALSAISAVRQGAHRVVARFDPSMDPAYLSHRAMVGPVVGEDFALQLIASELFAVLASAEVESAVHQTGIDERLSHYFTDLTTPRKLAKYATSKPVEVSGESAHAVLSRGLETAGPLKLPDGQPKALAGYPSITSVAYEADEAVDRAVAADKRFAMLSCLARSPDFEGPDLRPPVLRLGTLLVCHAEAESGNDVSGFWLCLQPLCDSVRLPDGVQFPLLPLTVVAGEGVAFDFVAPQPGIADQSDPHCLAVGSARFRDIRMRRFDPDSAERVVAARWQSDAGWGLDDTEGRRYRWLGELRSDLAHRTVASLSARLSRIGLDQSEYLRLSQA